LHWSVSLASASHRCSSSRPCGAQAHLSQAARYSAVKSCRESGRGRGDVTKSGQRRTLAVHREMVRGMVRERERERERLRTSVTMTPANFQGLSSSYISYSSFVCTYDQKLVGFPRRFCQPSVKRGSVIHLCIDACNMHTSTYAYVHMSTCTGNNRCAYMYIYAHTYMHT